VSAAGWIQLAIAVVVMTAMVMTVFGPAIDAAAPGDIAHPTTKR
jgi:hypothetical protein